MSVGGREHAGPRRVLQGVLLVPPLSGGRSAGLGGSSARQPVPLPLQQGEICDLRAEALQGPGLTPYRECSPRGLAVGPALYPTSRKNLKRPNSLPSTRYVLDAVRATRVVHLALKPGLPHPREGSAPVSSTVGKRPGLKPPGWASLSWFQSSWKL